MYASGYKENIRIKLPEVAKKNIDRVFANTEYE